MELIKKELTYYDPIIEKRILHDESSDMIVPDSYPDIAKISGAIGNVSVKETSVQNGRILISGTIKASVFYIPDGEESPKILDLPISFAHIEDASALEAEAISHVSAEIRTLESSMLNPRKLSVKACVLLDISVYGKQQLSISTDIICDTNEFVQVLKETQTISYPERIQCKAFHVLDSIDLGQDKIAKMCVGNIIFKTDEIRIVAGKAVLKGSAACDLVGSTIDDKLLSKSISMPFTQIVEIEGIQPDYQVECKYCMKDFDLARDKEAAGSVYDMRISADLFIQVVKKEDISVVSDMFSTRWSCETETASLKICAHSAAEITQPLKENIASDSPIASVLTCSCCFGAYHVSGDEHNIVNSDLYLSAFCCAEDEQFFTISKIVPVSFEYAQKPSENIHLFVSNYSASVSSDGGVAFDGTLVCNIGSEEGKKSVQLASANVLVGTPNINTRSASLILRYASDGENIWNTAKEYCSSIHDIEEANGLTPSAQIQAGQLLLIPLKK